MPVELVLVFDTGMEGIEVAMLVVDVVCPVLELLVVLVVFFAGLVLRLVLRV